MIYHGTLNFIIVWFVVIGTGAALTFAGVWFYSAWKRDFKTCRGCYYWKKRGCRRDDKR